jgi:hypothetical protein
LGCEDGEVGGGGEEAGGDELVVDGGGGVLFEGDETARGGEFGDGDTVAITSDPNQVILNYKSCNN